MALSMSVSAGKHNARHNTDLGYRSKLENVDPSLSANNVVLADEAIGDAYDRLFGEALERYNERQRDRHPERVIRDYHAKIDAAWRADQAKVESGAKGCGNVPQPCYEYVIQVGNRDTWKSVPTDTLTQIYTETFERLKDKTAGAIDWFQAAIHYDEPDGSGHMHVSGIPYGTGNKRGLETQVSMNQALRNLGLQRLPDLQNLIMVELEDVAHEHGIERDVMGCDRKHQDVAAWKQTQRDVAAMTDRLEKKTEQVAQVERRLECLRREEGELAEEVAELEEEAAKPVGETLAESARTLYETRSDAGRERSLRETNKGLRERISALEGQRESLEDEARGLEREIPKLERGIRRVEPRLERLRGRVARAVERLGYAPDRLSRFAQEMARKMGKPVLDHMQAMTRWARETSRAQNAQRWSQPSRDHGRTHGHGR